MRKLAVIDLCICAIGIALHIILEMFCTIRIGNDLKITLTALPFIVIAFLCGPVEGLITGLVGSFLSQLLTYGITVTTVLWILPYAVQALIAGLIFRRFQRKINIKTVAVSVFISGLVSVIITWIVSYIDGVVIFKYMTLEVLVALIPIRLVVWVIVSVAYSLVTIAVTKALFKSCPAGIREQN